MAKNKKIKKKLYTHATCVKLDENEYENISEASKVTGKSIPEILRSCYFKKPIGRPLIANDMAKTIRAELKRIGNNVNQIARLMNSGIYDGWHSEFRDFHRDFAKICQLLVSYSRS